MYKSKKRLLGEIVYSDSDLIIGLYEHYLTVADLLDKETGLFDGDIFVADNNLYEDIYPFPKEYLSYDKLYDLLQNETETAEMEYVLNYYAEIEKLGEEYYGIKYINKHVEYGVPVIDTFDETNDDNMIKVENEYKKVNVESEAYNTIKYDLLLKGIWKPVEFLSVNETDLKYYRVFISVLNGLNLDYSIDYTDRFEILKSDLHIKDKEIGESTENINNKFEYLLRRYWGEGATFRDLSFYKNPEFSTDTIRISQGYLISQIIKQSEDCLVGKDYRNIFITAPTGAGKSILFQLPSLHLAENYNLVTIIVTPLIALMQDQVLQLEEERNIEIATFINSIISYEEREHRIQLIKEGKKSLIYLAPELLISTPLSNLIGERKVGLFVIDEAHIVTSWGKDFRADYWFLGNYITKSRRESIRFPVLCLTATAVYGGIEDIVNETIESLELDNPLVFLGDVKRENIKFDIRQISRNSFNGAIEEYKIRKTAEYIKETIDRGEKTLIYCPYTSQVNDVYDAISDETKKSAGRYHAKLTKYERSLSQEEFKYGKYKVMICTKAFGMGIDVSDIKNVYHYAPTGNLSDYVQEIGRAARNKNTIGIAKTDYLPTDLRYIRMLYGMSGIKQYQLKEIIRKIFLIYSEKKHRNLLISPDTFSYLFAENELENKVKNGLLLISKDLEATFGFPVINVRPKNVFTKNYICVPEAIEKQFIDEYSRYVKIMRDYPRYVPLADKRLSNMVIRNAGNIYEIDMSKIWEEHFSNLTFPDFKRRFFEGELFKYDTNEKPTARMRLKINYQKRFDDVKETLTNNMSEIVAIFSKYKQQGTTFTATDFKKDMLHSLPTEMAKFDLSKLILDLFKTNVANNLYQNYGGYDKYNFIQEKREKSTSGMTYRVMNSNYNTLVNHFSHLLSQTIPNDGNIYHAFIPVSKGHKKPKVLKLLSVLELFGLATYEISGGKNIEIFIRVNDPVKLKRLSSEKYHNALLSSIEEKRAASQITMQKFMSYDFTDEERWDIIEHYFLGREDYMDQIIVKKALHKHK